MDLGPLLLTLVIGIALATLLIGDFLKDRPFEVGITGMMSIFCIMGLFGVILDSRPDMAPTNVDIFSFESVEKQQITEFVTKKRYIMCQITERTNL